MTSSPRSVGVAALAAAMVLGAGAVPATAAPDPVATVIDELHHCVAWADEPGGNPVVGSGGATCRAVHSVIFGSVCLVYNGVTLASSCNVLHASDGSDSASTNQTKCLPGLWQTQTTVIHAQRPDTEVLSDPVLLTCLP